MKIKYLITIPLLLSVSCSEKESEIRKNEMSINSPHVIKSTQREGVVIIERFENVKRKPMDFKGQSMEEYYTEKANIEYKKSRAKYKDMVEIPKKIQPIVEEKAGIIEVTWLDLEDPNAIPAPRAGYYAIMRFDSQTGEFLELLSAP